MPGSKRTVRLHRSMTSRPSARAPRTSGQKAGDISGAPPVMSTVFTCGEASRTRSTCSTVSSSIASLRRGLDSTWQCVHAWLQCSPTLSCRMVTSCFSSPACLGTPTSCARNSVNSGTPSASRARRRRLRSCSDSRALPTFLSSSAFTLNSEPAASISDSVSGMRLPLTGAIGGAIGSRAILSAGCVEKPRPSRGCGRHSSGCGRHSSSARRAQPPRSMVPGTRPASNLGRSHQAAEGG